MIDKTLLRLSVSPVCNLRCCYCPPTMENRAPERFDNLSTSQVVQFLQDASESGVRGVSLTGGEPWLRSDLIDLVEQIRSIGVLTRIEITTNGTANEPDSIPAIVMAGITHAKVSLDTLDPRRYEFITKRPLHSKVLENLAAYKAAGVPTSINCVLAKSTLPEIPHLLKFAINHGYNLSLLDLVYDSQTHDFWVSEYCPATIAEDIVGRTIGQEGKSFDRFGCRTTEYSVAGITVHIKDSTRTMRNERCRQCKEYCQEGLFSLRLSTSGWLTSCPNVIAENGISTKDSKSNLRLFLEKMAFEFSNAICTDSFGRFSSLL